MANVVDNNQIAKIKVEALIYELSQILKITPESIKISIETGITFKGTYDKSTMLRMLCNPPIEMTREDNKIINSYDPSLYITITTADNLKYSGRLILEKGEMETLCFSTLREQNGYEPEVKQIKCKSKNITKLILGGKLNKYTCKFNLEELANDKQEGNTLKGTYIAAAILNYIKRKQSFIKEEDLPKRK